MTNMNENVKKSLEHQEALIKHIKNTDGVYHDHHCLLVTYIATNIELLKFKYNDTWIYYSWYILYITRSISF